MPGRRIEEQEVQVHSASLASMLGPDRSWNPAWQRCNKLVSQGSWNLGFVVPMARVQGHI